MFKLYLSSFGSLFFLFALLITGTVSMFIFKHKIHSLKRNLSQIDSLITQEKKRASILEADRTLQHSSENLKAVSDSVLSARFTTVRQIVAINDLKRSSRAVAN